MLRHCSGVALVLTPWVSLVHPLYIPGDPKGILAALRRLHRAPSAYRQLWFGHYSDETAFFQESAVMAHCPQERDWFAFSLTWLKVGQPGVLQIMRID
jgi:hypothetical protein